MADLTVRGLREWEVQLTRAESRSVDEVAKVVRRGAVNIKQDARRRTTGLGHAPFYPASIGFDEYTLPGEVRATIGPDKGMQQGALGNILEYGTANNPPIPHFVPAAQAEGPRFERALGDLARDLLER